jgi:DNA-binding FadR family transcriptional regulator
VLGPIARAIDAALVERDAAAAEEGVRRLLRSGRERLLKALEARAARR